MEERKIKLFHYETNFNPVNYQLIKNKLIFSTIQNNKTVFPFYFLFIY